MSTTITLLLQTRVEATLVIISLLLVSAIIGYVTAWLYFRFIHKRKNEELKSIIEKHEDQNNVLYKRNNELENELEEKARELEQSKNEAKNLKSINSKNENENSRITLTNAKNKEKISEQNEALLQIANRKHLIDYNSFGKAKIEDKDDLQMISGIGPFIEERLHAIDIYSFQQISRFTAHDIHKINIAIEYFAGRIERDEWVAQAKELLIDEAQEAILDRIRARKTQIYFNRIGIASKLEADDLTLISGIGGWIEKKLNALDIYTFKQIANFNNEDIDVVTDAIEFFPGRIERDEWVHQAKDLVQIEGKKEDLLNRIREKKSAISYTNFGVAHKHHANNLTLIKGISLWVEERLNLLDIFTFEQISKFSTDDVKAITEILEISSSRIHKDNWIGQAKELLKDKAPTPIN